MKNGFRVIDAEPHFEEPYDLWEKELPEPFRSRTKIIPPPKGHLQPNLKVIIGEGAINADLSSAWVDAADPGSMVAKQAARRWPTTPHLVEARVPYSRPEVYREGFDTEGVDIGMLMPTATTHILHEDGFEAEHAMAIARVYNDWAYRWCQADPARFKFWGLVTAHDAELAAEEARRCMGSLGAVGITIASESAPRGTFGGKHLVNDEDLNPLWEELDRLQAPVGFHGFGGGRDINGKDPRHRRAEWVMQFDGPHATAVAGLIFGGVLDRYQNIKPVFMESGANGIPYMLETMNDRWWLFGPDADFTLKMQPSEYYKSRCYAVTYAEGLLKYSIDYLGDDHLLFSTDYPHHDCPFPNGVKGFLEVEGVSDEGKRKILWDNPALLFGLE